jgi:recombination protein RecA
MKKTLRRSAQNPEAEMQAIQKKLGYLTLELQPREWLDTGSRLLNATLGSEEKGIAYGKMIELFGPESNGKTLLALLLAGLAQADEAELAWVDFENSLDKPWAESQGVELDRLYHFFPKLIKRAREEPEGETAGAKKKRLKRDKGGKPRLQTAEELCDEVELWMERRHAAGVRKMMVVIDSVTAMLVEEEAVAGNTGQNMRTNAALPSFLSKLLRRWVALSQVYSTAIVFINQLRTAPGKWGNPEVTPGGKALKFYCSIRASVRRVKGGRLLQKGRMIGLKGIIANFKNKAGEGSLEGWSCGFKALFLRNDWRFLSAAKLKKDAEERGE